MFFYTLWLLSPAISVPCQTLQVGGSLRVPLLRKSRSAVNLKSTRISKVLEVAAGFETSFFLIFQIPMVTKFSLNQTPVPAAASRSQTSTPKSSLGGRKEGAEKKEEAKSRKTPSPAVSQVPKTIMW